MSIIHDALKKVQQELGPEPKPPVQNKIKPLLALSCALMITAACVLYIRRQFPHDTLRIQTFAKKSFYQLIHKEELPDFKATKPEDFVAPAKTTLKPPKPLNPPVPAKLPAISNTAIQNAPVTLNIHGVMSGSGGSKNLVLINDQVYQEGDEVDGAKIVKINLDSIKVINNGTEQTIFVKN